MKAIIYIVSTVIVLSFISCNDIFVDENPSNNPVENFDLLWKVVDEHYCYFDEKKVDWQALKTKYRPMVNNEMRDKELFEVMAKLLGELKDGHVNLIAPFNLSHYWDWYLDYPQNFNYTLVERNYLGKDHITTSGMKAKKINNIGYMYYGSFMNDIKNEEMDFILSEFKDCKGIIIDIRNNGGGSVTNEYDLAKRFTDKEIAVGYTKFKTGKGHSDFSKLHSEKVKPYDGIRFTKQIVLLTNRSTYSAANEFAGMMKYFDNVIQMGDTTGGGGASPSSYFLMNGWEIRLSSMPFLSKEKETWEFGVMPDIVSELKTEDEAKSVDTIIEQAIAYINNK
ncbi:MAG: S41 family peptidase [Dysgonomonas sp.]